MPLEPVNTRDIFCMVKFEKSPSKPMIRSGDVIGLLAGPGGAILGAAAGAAAGGIAAKKSIAASRMNTWQCSKTKWNPVIAES